MKSHTYLIALSLFFSLLTANGQNTDAITADDLYEISNMLYWNVEIPDDLEKNEVLTSQWRIASKTKKDNIHQASKLNFDGIPAGTKVKIFVWIPAADEKTDSLKYCLRYKNLYSLQQTVKGEIEIPKGFNQLYSFAPTGTWLSDDESFILAFSNSESDELCMLDFVYTQKTSQKTPPADK